MSKPSLFCGQGWVYLDPEGGLSYVREHPKHSGECPDAEAIRRSTEMEDWLWREWQSEWAKSNKHLFPPLSVKTD